MKGGGRNRFNLGPAGEIVFPMGIIVPINGAVGIHELHIHGSPIGSSGVVVVSSNDQVRYAVSVQVTQRACAVTEIVEVGERRPTIRDVGNLRRTRHMTEAWFEDRGDIVLYLTV